MAKRSAVTIILIVVVSIILLVALNFLTAPVIDENAKASATPEAHRTLSYPMPEALTVLTPEGGEACV